jgi:hypothetical protein
LLACNAYCCPDCHTDHLYGLWAFIMVMIYIFELHDEKFSEPYHFISSPVLNELVDRRRRCLFYTILSLLSYILLDNFGPALLLLCSDSWLTKSVCTVYFSWQTLVLYDSITAQQVLNEFWIMTEVATCSRLARPANWFFSWCYLKTVFDQVVYCRHMLDAGN